MVWRIPNLLCTRRCRINREIGVEMRLAGEAGEYALSHGGTTDVAVADEKYLYHNLLYPLISSQALILLALWNFFKIMYSLIFSHKISCF